MAKKGGLGRGLDILFQDTGAGGGDEGVSTLRLAEIEPDKNQPRKAFDLSLIHISEPTRH